MVDQLIALMGHSIESEEVKKLLVDWNVIYPRKVFCTAENPILKDKIEKHCVRLYFGIAGESPFLTRIPTGWEGGFIAQLVRIEFTPKRTYFIPFDITYAMTQEELTRALGEPIVTQEDEVTITTWRRPYTEQHELIVKETVKGEAAPVRAIHLAFVEA